MMKMLERGGKTSNNTEQASCTSLRKQYEKETILY